MFSIVVAADNNNGIGFNNSLPWIIKEDMKYFKQLTTSTIDKNEMNVVVMGRKTFESIPEKFRPLPNRINVVISNNKSLSYDNMLNTYIVHSFEEALEIKEKISDIKIDNMFVIGGAQIYYQALKHENLQMIYLTRINNVYNCDTFIDKFDEAFCLIKSSALQTENNVQFRFEEYKRISCCM